MIKTILKRMTTWLRYGSAVFGLIFFHVCGAEPYASAPHVMVVSAQHYATQVGINILKKGGNAIDAAVAMGYALAVVHPCCGNIGGGGFMLIHLANGTNKVIDFRETAPKNISQADFNRLENQGLSQSTKNIYEAGELLKPYLYVGVPGTVLGLETANKRYGKMPMAKLIEPAIQLAQQGYRLLPEDVKILNTGTASFKRYSNTQAIFLNQGKNYQAGELLRQADLATTLKAIAVKGSSVFYRGYIAHQIVKASEENGGRLSLADFQNYQVKIKSPLVCSYRGYQIVTLPLPGSGITTCQILQTAEAFPLAKYGAFSPKTMLVMTEAMRLAFVDRNQYLGDPDFVRVPVQTLMSPQHIQGFQDKIHQKLTDPATTDLDQPITWQEPAGHDTTAFLVVDRKGNAVAVTYTINSFFGARVIPGHLGFFLNNELDDFTLNESQANQFGLMQGKPNFIQGGKRPLSSISSTLVFKNHQLFLMAATPGGSTIPTQIVEAIQDIIDFGMDLKAAINAPRYHMQGHPNVLYIEPNALSDTTQQKLKEWGYHIQTSAPWGKNRTEWGALNLMQLSSQLKQGAIDKRRPQGSAAGY